MKKNNWNVILKVIIAEGRDCFDGRLTASVGMINAGVRLEEWMPAFYYITCRTGNAKEH